MIDLLQQGPLEKFIAQTSGVLPFCDTEDPPKPSFYTEHKGIKGREGERGGRKIGPTEPSWGRGIRLVSWGAVFLVREMSY